MPELAVVILGHAWPATGCQQPNGLEVQQIGFAHGLVGPLAHTRYDLYSASAMQISTEMTSVHAAIEENMPLLGVLRHCRLADPDMYALLTWLKECRVPI